MTYNKYDIATGLWPYNVDFTPDGKLALTPDNRGAGSADGNVDTISVIDMQADPPRAIDQVVVGDGPEGLSISPAGGFAATALLRGSNASKKAFFYNKNGSTVLLRIDGNKVTKVKEVEVGGCRNRSPSRPTANTSMSAISSTRTSRSCVSRERSRRYRQEAHARRSSRGGAHESQISAPQSPPFSKAVKRLRDAALRSRR